MSNIKVSVIIPVYNVEPYLRECLDSVINQTLKEIEIICIDDCSTDNSYQILEEYAKKDNRMVVYKNEKNKGSGPTRNVGIKNSKGEYISFIDPDDYISKDYFESLYNTAKKFNSDITNNINTCLDTNSKISYYHTNLNRTSKLDIEYESETKIKNINILSKNIITTVIWNKIFKKEFLIKNELLFMENKIGSAEDADFIIRTIINDPKISFNNFGKYYYRIRSDSAMNITGNNDKYLTSAIKHVQNTIFYCKQKKIEDLDYVYIKTWNSVYLRFNISNELNRKNCYKYVYEFVYSISIKKDLIISNSEEYNLYKEYLLIKSNDTYEKYLLNKELYDKINNINNKLNELDKKINQINSNIQKINTNTISKNIKLFGIDNFEDKKIIYILGIRITLKKNKYKKFIKHKILNNSVLIIEPNMYHGETLPGFIKYFKDLNYNIDILINSNLFNDKVLSSFNHKNINNLFDFNQLEIIDDILLLPVIKKYKIVFFNSYLFYDHRINKRRSLFVYNKKILDNLNKYICVEHDIITEYEIERNIDRDRLITLLPNNFCTKYINPHYFFEKKVKNKNKITKFSVFAREKESYKNIQLIIELIKKIIDLNITDLNLTLIGRIDQLNIDISGYEKYITFTGYLNYENLYKEVEESDFILPMLDPNIEKHKRFLVDTSGSFQLIYGFGKVPIIHSFFSERCGFNKDNALIYKNNEELIENIKYAISMTNEEYMKKSKMIFEYSDILYKESLANLIYMLE